MELLLQITLFIILTLLVIVGSALIIYGVHYFTWFHLRSCKHCGHYMEYKGLKEDNDEGHYLFHCPHCGAWEQIPKHEFFREAENIDFTNPYNS